MKKTSYCLSSSIINWCTVTCAVWIYGKLDAKGPSVIPKEAVRLRILANSDSDKDQALKRKVRDEVKAQIDGWVADLTSFEEARKVIQSHIPEIEKQ